MSESIQVAFASGSDDLIPTLVERMREIAPEAELYLVSEFQLEGVRWVPYHVARTGAENLALCRSVFGGRRIRLAGLILQPRMPYWRMRWLALRVGGLWRTAFFNENLDHFMIRPRSAGAILRHLLWRAKNIVRWELRPGGATYTLLWRLGHPRAFLRPLALAAARLAGRLAAARKRMDAARPGPAASRWFEEGVSVVIPSRNGRELLESLLPGLFAGLAAIPSEVIVVDNGSADGTAAWLAGAHSPVIVEASSEPLSFARAVNRGILRARRSRVLLLNNDMKLEPGFFPALLAAFDRVPELFCATAQILFPEGKRREETGKAVMTPAPGPEDFPVRCELPIEGEEHSWVLYGSGGCSMYDTAKLRALGGMLEIYEPAYVEDLDLGFRGWQRGWPSVFVSGARVVHRHRATTSRYYTQAELDRVLEINYLKFLAATVRSGDQFARLWRQALNRLDRRAGRIDPEPAAMAALRQGWRALLWAGDGPPPVIPEEAILAVGGGEAAVFPGAAARRRPVVLVASPYLPYPLSHGGAVRMYNLMRRAAADYEQVLVCFVDELQTPPAELLGFCAEIVLVRRRGSHARPLTARPDVVEEFDRPAFRQALRLTVKKWRPAVVQLEFTQMAQYAADCRPAPTVLVEHDVTLDLYRQLLDRAEDWETRQQYERWLRFETAAWKEVDAVAAMSEKDRRAIGLPKAVVLANGVDLERFRPSGGEPEPGRVLFIGSFAHLPNVLAVDWLLRRVWPLVRAKGDARLHVIAGSRHRYFLERYRDRVDPPLEADGVEVEDFVADPRPAYHRAAVVVAPLLASAGTNIKIMEAMAMGKAIVSTPAGINGLDELQPGRDLLVAGTSEEMAAAVCALLGDGERRRAIERQARRTVERGYGWDAIAARQRALYQRLIAHGAGAADGTMDAEDAGIGGSRRAARSG